MLVKPTAWHPQKVNVFINLKIKEMSNELPLTVYKKLLEVKKKVPYLKKDKSGFNYTYVTPSAVFATINPILNDVGLILVTNVIDCKSYEITPVIGKDGKVKSPEWKFDLNFIFDWVDVETGEKVSIPWSASGCNGEDKGLGSALTYAERYFILKQFNIPTDNDDPDAFEDKHMTAEEKAEKEKKSKELLKESVDIAIKNLGLCDTPKDLADLLKTTPDFIKQVIEFSDAFNQKLAKFYRKAIKDSNTLDDLKTNWEKTPKDIQPLVVADKDARKKDLEKLAAKPVANAS